MHKRLEENAYTSSVAVSIFYVTYIVFEVPLVVAFKMVGPRRMGMYSKSSLGFRS